MYERHFYFHLKNIRESSKKKKKIYLVKIFENPFHNLIILTLAINLAAVLLISQRFQWLSATKATEANAMVRYSGNDLGK